MVSLADIFRYDMSLASSCKTSGGVVLVAAKSYLQVHLIQNVSTEIEDVFLSVGDPSCPILIFGLYIPPQKPTTVYVYLGTAVDEMMLNFPTITSFSLVGDFNLPEVNWHARTPNPLGSQSRVIINLANTFDLYIVHSVLNAQSDLLDLLLCSDCSTSGLPAFDPLLHEEPAHTAIQFDITIPKPRLSTQHITYVFNKCDLDTVYRRFHHLLGPEVFHMPDVTEYFDTLLGSVHRIMLENTLTKKMEDQGSVPLLVF